jgi:hypothetical protein
LGSGRLTDHAAPLAYFASSGLIGGRARNQLGFLHATSIGPLYLIAGAQHDPPSASVWLVDDEHSAVRGNLFLCSD